MGGPEQGGQEKMKKKIIGILVVALLIATALPTMVIGREMGDKTTKIAVNEEIANPSFWTYDRPHTSNFKPDYGTISKTNFGDPPSSFDLRNVDGKNYVTSVKCQSGGTCWAHAVIACMEGNLLMTGNWEKAGETGKPNLAEYHLDWWNGFNTFFNDDVPSSDGLTPHHGAQCRIAAAYFARGEGAMFSEDANDETEYDDNWYHTAPNRFDDSYHIYYPRHIEIYDIGENLQNIDLIKNKIMNYGPINIVFLINSKWIDENYTSYQPPTSPTGPNHNVAIIGWDDSKNTPASENGAWLCKNSWCAGWGLNGYFWISYYDKYCCHPYDGDEWTASFQQVEPMSYKRVYYHDYHGWQDDFEISNEAFNAFTAEDNEILSAVSFYTCTNNVNYQVRIFDQFKKSVEYKNGELQGESSNILGTMDLKGELSNISGTIDFMGFHTIELDQPVYLTAGDRFYIYLQLSDGGIPYDRTHSVWGNTIESISHRAESYYYENGAWHDLYKYNNTANFCIKGLVSKISDLKCDDNINWKKFKPGSTIKYNLSIANVGETFSKLNWEIIEWPDWGTWSFSLEEDYLYPESGAEIIQVSVVAPDGQNQEFSGEIKIVNKDDSSDYELIQISLTTPKNKPINTPFLNFLEHHPHLLPLLRQLLSCIIHEEE